ncbi:DUF2231 domain-containing protein [Actinomadura montaniterrae]|uniref:DUF2231 domain-containing protein n=1 Tax=Actinomadura montaniterrae TaxID=1803903 RepID=A0A6L3VWM8_9ACTN|nr:DUF2231 domain-containing protein [Actinomadura montaniterrae]KAB2381908.1 DUF2231 domain-containing protein [Actinomadura montaniterrae]
MDALRQAKRPVSALAGPYGHPLHPLLVTVPIGAWTCSLVFDVASRLVGDPAFLAKGSMWLIGIGVAGALAAASAGFLDLLAIAPGTPAFRSALVHMSLNLAVTLAYVGGFGWRTAADHAGAVGAGQLALSAVSFAALAVSGYLGGRLAYRYGVRVADETAQAEGFTQADGPTQADASTQADGSTRADGLAASAPSAQEPASRRLTENEGSP